ncbi:MAG: hypothetical protein JWO53_246 [Chlamydiia bacterium]|nr:hypothetical protein [Chlamydiia bacterium]
MGNKSLKTLFILCHLGCFFSTFCFPFLLPAATYSHVAADADINALPIASKAWLDDQDYSLDKIEKLAKDYKRTKAIFHEINAISKEIKKKPSIIGRKLFFEKNRNPSFLPYDENRTCREIPDFYISASDISTPEQNYIAAQAPIQSTIQDFWRMLIEKKCPLVITTAMPIEKDCDKCHGYWLRDALPVITNGWQITSSDEDESILGKAGDHQLVKRSFICVNTTTKEKRIITQLHYQNWPDNGIPDCKLFIQLLDEVDLLHTSKKIPITIHCSAGVGRTGTFITAHTLRKTILRAKKNNLNLKTLTVNVPKMIISLRMQRLRIVATARQLQTIYQTLNAAAAP